MKKIKILLIILILITSIIILALTLFEINLKNNSKSSNLLNINNDYLNINSSNNEVISYPIKNLASYPINKSKPFEITSKVIFLDPLNKCPGYLLARGFSSYHSGIDLTKAGGCIITSSTSGIITKSEWSIVKGYNVQVNYNAIYSTNYYHGATFPLVKVGDVVKAGQDIMIMGSTGNATGIHLHFEILKNNQAVDPTVYIHFK